jgi:hypothetical protein
MRGVDGGHGGLGDLCLCGGDGSDTFCCCGRPVLTKLLRILAPGRTSTAFVRGLCLKWRESNTCGFALIQEIRRADYVFIRCPGAFQ